jgi:hypothetical protein
MIRGPALLERAGRGARFPCWRRSPFTATPDSALGTRARPSTKRWLRTAQIGAVWLGCTTAWLPRAAPVAAAETETTNTRIPIVVDEFVPCANAGAGELVTLSGTLHVLQHTTIDEAGGVHVTLHVQPAGVSGTGQTTGDRYRGTGVTQQQFNTVGASTQTLLNNFRIIGEGPRNNLLVHHTFHVTVNANGEVTATVDNFNLECQ